MTSSARAFEVSVRAGHARITLACAAALAAMAGGCRDRKPSSDPSADPANAPPQAAPELEPRTWARAGSPVADTARSHFAIFYLPTPRRDPARALEAAVRTIAPYMSVAEHADDLDVVPPMAVYTLLPAADYLPPDRDALEYYGRGLTDTQVEAVQACERVLVVEFHAGQEHRLRVARDAMEIMTAVEKRTTGLMWDEDARLLYAPDGWAERTATWRGELPTAPKLYVAHYYRDDGQLLRMVTLGLGKLGLPDLVVTDVSPGDYELMLDLINLAAQTLVEGGMIEPGGWLRVDARAVQDSYVVLEGGTGKALLRLAVTMPGEGDADNRLWEIVFDGDPREDVQVRHNNVLGQVVGLSDAVHNADHDAELLAASAAARERLLAKKASFAEGVPFRERLLVKAPFARDDADGNEWMWVEVLEWKGPRIVGVLANTPFHVQRLKAGARVEVDEADVFDYLHHRADGTTEGNTTGDILQRREYSKP